MDLEETSPQICLHKPLNADVSKIIADDMLGKLDSLLFHCLLHHTVMDAAKLFLMEVKTLVQHGEDTAASMGQNNFTHATGAKYKLLWAHTML